MLTIPAALLAIFVGSSPAEKSRVDIEVKDLVTAPTVEPMPEDLPDPRAAPDDGRWKDDDGTPRPAGTFLQAPLDMETFKRVDLLERMPALHQVQLSKLRDFLVADCDGRLAVTEAACIASNVSAMVETPAKGWSTLEMLIGIVGGIVVGGVAMGIYFLAKTE